MKGMRDMEFEFRQDDIVVFEMEPGVVLTGYFADCYETADGVKAVVHDKTAEEVEKATCRPPCQKLVLDIAKIKPFRRKFKVFMPGKEPKELVRKYDYSFDIVIK